MAVESAAVSVATTATALNTAVSSAPERVSLLLHNAGSATVYLGGSAVTTSNGVPLAAGSSVAVSDLAFDEVHGLTTEARQKLSRARPLSLGQASRLPGITAASISALLVYLKKRAG